MGKEGEGRGKLRVKAMEEEKKDNGAGRNTWEGIFVVSSFHQVVSSFFAAKVT